MRPPILTLFLCGPVLLGAIASGPQARADVPFVRGDVNQDGAVQMSDSLSIICELFLGCPLASCRDAADVNDSGEVDVADPIYLLNYLFVDGDMRPPPPFPGCGTDPTEDAASCELFDNGDCVSEPPQGFPAGLVHVVGRVIDLLGDPVPNARVAIGGRVEDPAATVVRSDSTGFFAASVSSARVRGGLLQISVRAAGYTSNQIKLAVGSTSAIHDATVVVAALDSIIVDVDPFDGVQATISGEGDEEFRLDIPGTVMPTSNPVTVELARIDPGTEEIQAFPGSDFLAAVPPTEENGDTGTAILETFGLVEVRITDNVTGEEISELDGEATLEMRLGDDEQDDFAPGDRIPWWYYDEAEGIWVQDGEAEVFTGLDGLLWTRARARHFTWWNVDKPIRYHSCIRFRPVRTIDGRKLANLQIFAAGVTYNGQSPGRLEDDDETYCFTVKRSMTGSTERVRFYVEIDGVRLWLVDDGIGGFTLTADADSAWTMETPAVNASCVQNFNVDGCLDLGERLLDLNLPPRLRLLHTRGSTCGEDLRLEVLAWDPEEDAMSTSWQTPDGGSFVGGASGNAVTWRPPAADGVYTVVVTATDAFGASDRREIALRVGSPCCPEIRSLSAPTSVDPRTTSSLRIEADVDDEDTPVDDLVYTWRLPDGTEAAGDSVDWSVEGTGLVQFSVTVSDGDCTAEGRADVIIDNAAPVIRGVAVDNIVAACRAVRTLTADAFDADGDDLTYEWSATGGELLDAGTATVRWQAPASGAHGVTVTVRDGYGGEVTETIRFAPGNAAPRVTRFVATPVDEIDAGAEVQVEIEANDEDGEIRSYEWTVTDGTVTLSAEGVRWTLGDDETQWIGVTIRDDCDAETTEWRVLSTGSPVFFRGDANLDGSLDLADAILILSSLDLSVDDIGGLIEEGEPTQACRDAIVDPTRIPCLDAADIDDDGRVACSDAIALASFLFRGGPPPRPPSVGNSFFYGPEDCGADPTPDGLDCAELQRSCLE